MEKERIEEIYEEEVLKPFNESLDNELKKKKKKKAVNEEKAEEKDDEEDYDEEEGEVPGEQDTGPDEYEEDAIFPEGKWTNGDKVLEVTNESITIKDMKRKKKTEIILENLKPYQTTSKKKQ